MSAPILRRRSQVAIALILCWRDMRAKFSSIWLYALASGVCAIVAFFAISFHKAFETETVTVAADPLSAVHGIVLASLGLILGIRAAMALSWEREHRTMEVLLSGPVTIVALVSAKLSAELATLIFLNIVYTIYMAIVRPVGDAWLLHSIVSYWYLSLLILPMIGLGVAVSALVSTVRGAVVTFVVVCLALGLVEGFTLWLNGQDANDLSLPVLYVRQTLDVVTGWLSIVSPVAYIADLFEILSGAVTAAPGIFSAATAVFVASAVVSSVAATRRAIT